MKTREELKQFSDEKLREIAVFCQEVKKIAETLYEKAEVLSETEYRPLEHKLVGMYTFINTVYKELNALEKNYEAIYFVKLKVKAEIDNVKFVAESAGREAKEFTQDLRYANSVVEGWVENIEQLLATCRRNLYVEKKEKRHA